MIDVLTEWKVPVSGIDICWLVKSYLDRRGITDSCFKEILLGIDWQNNFMKRHNLKQRISDNAKIRQAEINFQIISQYFHNLETTMENVKPYNMFNYDTTNVTNDHDPSVKKVIVRRGL